MDKAIKALKKEAHERVVARGLIQFRLDRERMEELLTMADQKGTGYGVLARMWVCDRLEQERKGLQETPETKQLRRLIREEIEKALKPSGRRKTKST